MTNAASGMQAGRSSLLARRVYVANLLAQCAIVVTGGVVRLTGSGLGCPTWPECVEGSYVPTARQEEAWHKYVEFGNRLLTFVLVILAVAAIAVALRDRALRRRAAGPRRSSVTRLAFVPLAGTVAQAVLGGITVLTGLHPATVAAHFLLSMIIIAGCVRLVVRSGEDADGPSTAIVPTAVVTLGRLLVATTAVVLVLGTVVTGSGPHGGDADTEIRFGLDPRTVAWLHADVVLLFIGLTIGMIVALHLVTAPTLARRRGWLVLGTAVVQGSVGYAQYFTGLPWVLVALHMAGACLVWVAVLFLAASLRRRGHDVPADIAELQKAG